MPELGLWPFTESITWGVTRNPWDTDRTPGGSSGGSAAAVAAGLVPAAVAADGAGSIRIPAACTGLFGLKPHSGRVPRAPHDEDGSHWICFGGLTRSVAGQRADARRDGARHRAPAAPAAEDRLQREVPARHARQAHARDARRAARHRGTAARPRARGRAPRPRLPRPGRAGARRADVPRDARHRGRDRAQAAPRAPHARDRPPGRAGQRPPHGEAAARRAADRASASGGCGTTTTCC